MATQPQGLTLEQKQALARARAKAAAQKAGAMPSAAPGMAMVAMGQSAGPRQPAPNPNAPNPIIAAQRASQTQAMGDFAAQKEAEARALAQRREGAGLGALTDMPMVYDDAGNMRPGTAADQDLSKGIVGSPINFGQGLAEGGANGMNALFAASTGIGNAVLNVFDPNREQSQPIRIDVPRNVIVDQGGPLESMSGVIPRVAGQISGPRVAIGKVAPGGNFGSSMAKDAIATGLGTPQDAPRISDMFPEGTPIADQLRTREGDSAFTAFGKNAAEDLLASTAIGGVMRGGTAILDAIGRPSGRAVSPAPMAPPVQPQPAAQPSVAPIPQPTVSNAPRRAAQPAAPGAGQGAPATLQATPTAAPGATPALANSDRKIIGRLLRAGGVPRNDVDRVLSGLVVAHQSSNSARLPLAFFAEEYLPTVLPKQTADDVIQKLRGFGRERYGANDPRDPSRSIVRNTINELRGSQRETLTNQFEGLLGKETLMTKQGKIARDKQGVAEAVYAEEIGRQQRLLAEGAAAPEQVAARDDLLGFMSRKDYFDQIPPEVKLKAADEGKDLWEYVHTNPLEAAHWLQSQLGVLARKGNTIAEAMRMPVVRRLEDSVPGYRGARMEYGDLSGQQAALEFGDDLYRVGGSKFATDQKALEFKKLSRAQKTVAKKSIRDKLLNEFRKAKTGDDQAAVITAMQKDGVLDALETILGPEGKKVADSIRGMVRENERLRAIDLQSGSNTADNLAQMRAAQEAVRSPVNRAVGSIGDESSYARTVFADAVSVALGLPPVWTAGKVGAGVVGKFGAPSKRKLASATRTLYDLPRTAGAAAPEAAPRRAPSRSTPRRQIEAPTQENLDALLKQYDQTPTPALRNKIIAMRKKMNLPARTGDEGFAGVTPMATLAGGAGGYLGAQDLNGDGTVDAGERAAFTALGLGGGYLGGRALSGKGGPKRARNALVPKAAEQPSVQRSYFAGPRGDTYEVTIEGTGRGAEVNFRPQGGDYSASGNMSLAEVNDVFRNVEKAIRDDIATNPKPRYVLEGATKQRRDIYEQIAKTRPAPEGYRWEMVSESGRRPYLTLTRSDAPPPARAPKPPPVKNGFADNATGYGTAGGAIAGGTFARDTNGDGVVDANERAAGALGGAITGGIAGKAVGAGARRMGKAPPMRNAPRRGPDQATFGGVNAKTADRVALARAQQMEASGADRNAIWDETGWFKGVDGKWRFEIDDSGAKFDPLPRTPYMTELANQYARENFGVDGVIYLPHNDVRRAEAIQWATNEAQKLNDAAKTQTAPLSERLSHPQLNSAYDLSGVKVSRETNPRLHGSYEPTSKMLRVSDESPVLGQKHDPRETALHETQHHVQSIEDFARGGNPDAEAAMMRDNSKKIAAIQTQIKSLLDGADRNTYDMWNELMLARVNGDNVRAGDINDMLAASGDTGRKLSDLLWESSLLKSRTGNEADAFDAYRRLAGEVEARNVQTRRDFTPAERRARRPWETQDVPDDQQIVRFGSGKAESRKPPVQNGFSGSKPPPAKGPPKPPGYGKVRLAPGVEVLPPDRNATKANPRKAGKAYPMTPSESAEIMAARKELRDAKAANTRARNRFVMRDNREELWAEADAREARAMDNLNRLLEEQAMKRQKAGRARDAYHSVKDFVYSERGGMVAGTLGAVGTVGVLGLGASMMGGGEKKQPKGVLAPTDPAYFMSNLKNNKDNLAAVQGALVDAGLLADGDDDGNWGKRTSDAIQAWLSRQPDRNPNLPLQDYEVPALLAEAYGGYQDADGKWYYDDGQPIRFPVPNTRGNMADRTLTPAEIRRLKFEERMRKQKAAAQ